MSKTVKKINESSDEEWKVDVKCIDISSDEETPVKKVRTNKRIVKEDGEKPVKARKATAKKTLPKKSPKKTLPKKTAKNILPKEPASKKNEPIVNNNIEGQNLTSTWTDETLLSELESIDYNISRNIIKLFSEDNTIPFIARYRKDLTGHMSPEKLRSVKKSYEEVIKIKSKASNILSAINKQGKLNNALKQCILSAKSINELDHLYAPFKVSKNSLAERARALGLEGVAINILNGTGFADPANFVREGTKGVESLVDVLLGCQHIIADILCKDKDLLDEIRKLYKYDMFYIESSQANQKHIKNELKQSSSHSKNKPVKNVDPDKFKLYFNFKSRTNCIQSYQVLAINRGESLKILNVKIVIPDRIKDMLYRFCEFKWLKKGYYYQTRNKLVQDSFNDAYKRLITPLISREIRSTLNKKAEEASIDVFTNNLKHLLMIQPVKGMKILGIDPGFSNGCKMAMISEQGKLLDTAVIYPHSGKTLVPENIIVNLMFKYNCSLIALGNGTACRETERFLSHLIKNEKFPRGTKYSIINERGASIYSCSDEATTEFPKLDPNLRSAVYIARCLQDPLCEMVKIDPKHLGIGMYQHDVTQKLLESSLHEVVIECVSFVGVDINTVSITLLRQVAGLGKSKAEKIIKFRDANGPFLSRDEVKSVPGIGPKSYEQFIGFIRVISDTSGKKANPLDKTWIHPESYDIAEKVVQRAKLLLTDLGKSNFIEALRSFIGTFSLQKLANEYQVPEAQVHLIVESLMRDPNKDYRCDNKSNEPLFKNNITNMEDLRQGEILTGIVDNVTDFGAFVDVGVGTCGLIHISYLRKFPYPIELGNRVEVRVLSLEIDRKRIGLELLQIL